MLDAHVEKGDLWCQGNSVERLEWLGAANKKGEGVKSAVELYLVTYFFSFHLW